MGALLSGIPQRDDVVDVDLVRSATHQVDRLAGAGVGEVSAEPDTVARPAFAIGVRAGRLKAVPRATPEAGRSRTG